MWHRAGIRTAFKFLLPSQMAAELHIFNLNHEPLQAWGNLLGIPILDLFAGGTHTVTLRDKYNSKHTV